MKTVVDVVRIKSDGIRIRSRRRLNNCPTTQTLFSRTLPEGENWIKHRNLNTTS
jgi:hypothetical protein